MIKDLDKDIKRTGAKIEKWISRTDDEVILDAEQASSSIEAITPSRYALNFKNSRYINDDVFLLSNHPNSLGFLCVTFRVLGEGPQTLISSYQKSTWAFREIQVDRAEIRIFYGGSESEIIQHPCHEWTTLYIGYHAQPQTTTWHYIINNYPKLDHFLHKQ